MNAFAITKPLLVVLGPTAVGKTALSIAIAERYNGEIVNCDSMQVYRYMDIGTAKPSIEERRGIPHHLLDVVTPEQPYDAACFSRDASTAITAIHERNRLPVVVGGTGLYLRALLYGLVPAPKIDEKLRDQLLTRLQTEGLASLFAELATLDPISAQRIAATDRQRVVRALEIYHSTGQPWSTLLENQGNFTLACRFGNILQIGLGCERQQLYQKINARCQGMVTAGLEEEVLDLLSRGYSPTLKSMGAIGYRHMLEYLAGRYSQKVMVDLMSRDTRRYAKRQCTWFSQDKTVFWETIDNQPTIFSVIERWLGQPPSLGKL